ncbi:hypothetical protein D7M15_15495 [Streptomyces sp. Z26]|nr:hypothetical protein D7M15_15495 [Streptomyces sp. Z26]
MMADGMNPRREYPFTGSTGALWIGLAPLVLGAAALVRDIATDDGVPAAVALAVGAFFVALFGLAATLVVRTPGVTTRCDEHGVTARAAFGTRTTAWPDVQGIEVDAPPSGQIAAEGTPRRFAVVYDATGRRYSLPNLDDRRCAALDHEVDHLRAVWQRHRGADWQPLTEVQDRITRRRHVNARVGLALIVFVTAMSAFVVGLVLCVGLLIGGAYPQIGDPDPGFVVGTLLHPAALMGGLPVLATAVAVTITLLRRRSH